MVKENTASAYHHDLLDELVDVIKQTTKPLYQVLRVDGDAYYGYGHKHKSGDKWPNFPLHPTEMTAILHADIKSTLHLLREIHPYATPHLLVALCSFVRQNGGVERYVGCRLCDDIKRSASLLEIIEDIVPHKYEDDVIMPCLERRREWEIYTILRGEQEKIKFSNYDLDF